MDPSHTVHLPGFLHALEPTLNNYGYLAVAGLVLIEDFGVPVPGETILILGAVYAGTGRLNIWLVGLIGFLAAVLGDNIGFAIGHFGGRALVERYGRYIFLTRERIDKATAFFERYGGWIVLIARFIEGLRQANGIIAGITGMHWAKFLAFNAVGAALWVGLWASVGYFAGDHITSIYNTATKYTLYVAIAVVVVLIAWIAWRVRRARHDRQAPGAGAATPARSAPAGAEEQAAAGAEERSAAGAEGQSAAGTEGQSAAGAEEPPAASSEGQSAAGAEEPPAAGA